MNDSIMQLSNEAMQFSNEVILAIISLVGTIVIAAFKYFTQLDQNKKKETAEKIKIALSIPEKGRADYILSVNETIRLDINKISQQAYDEVVKEIYSAKRLEKWLNFALSLSVLISIGFIGYIFKTEKQGTEKQKYTVTVCGTITDESGNGIEGATFHLLGFDKDTTDKKGYFSLKVEIYQKDTIFQYTASAVGYKDDNGKATHYDTSIDNNGCSFSKQLKTIN